MDNGEGWKRVGELRDFKGSEGKDVHAEVMDCRHSLEVMDQFTILRDDGTVYWAFSRKMQHRLMVRIRNTRVELAGHFCYWI